MDDMVEDLRCYPDSIIVRERASDFGFIFKIFIVALTFQHYSSVTARGSSSSGERLELSQGAKPECRWLHRG